MAGLNLNRLQNSYLTSLKSLTRTTGQRKKLDEKKDDEINAKPKPTDPFFLEKKRAENMFPITPNMFVLSGLFWVFMIVLIYYCISYGHLYSRISQEADLSIKCTDGFSQDKEKNHKRVDNYTLGDASPYLVRLQSSKKEDYPMESNVLPPVVTAITSAQFYQFQGLISHIMEDMRDQQSDLKLIVFDLGLNKRQRELVEKYCHCEVRTLHFEQYPSHVATVSNYAWRPIVLQQMLKEFGSVLYVDPTTRFKNPSSPNYLRMRGSRSYFVWDPMVFTSLVAYTDKGMFDYLKESRCAFQDCSMLSSESIALYRTEATWNEIMRPWLICALNADCISPKHARYSGCFDIRSPRTTGCHRYDMSALSIILNRGVQYTVDSEKMVSFRLTYTDDQELTYFPEQPWTTTQILLLIFTPILIFVAYKYFFKRRRMCRF